MRVGPCTRPTKAGVACRSRPVNWFRCDGPDPESCRTHLTKEEAARLAVGQRRFDEEWGHLVEARERIYHEDPACWSWPAPLPGSTLYHWQAGRCAICSIRERLVVDHDHETGLIRGLLCQSCNALEGFRANRAFIAYRERPPSVICGIREFYFDAFTGRYAEPRPEEPESDQWKDNALKGVL